MKAARLALIFAIVSCIIPPLVKTLEAAYPEAGSNLYFRMGNRAPGNSPFFDEETAERYGMYRGYTLRERTRAGIMILGAAFLFLAFFIGRAGMKGTRGKKRNTSLAAALIALCASSGYGAGIADALLLLLILWSRLREKDEIPAGNMDS